MLNIKIRPERENFKLPIRGTKQAACYDCYASEIEIQHDGAVHVKLGFSTEIPEGYCAELIPRSNLTKYSWVFNNSIGIIDSDYRNEWQARFRPIPYLSDVPIEGNETITARMLVISNFPYKVGDRVCQIKFEKVNPVEFTITQELSETIRGKGGFGSTGINKIY